MSTASSSLPVNAAETCSESPEHKRPKFEHSSHPNGASSSSSSVPPVDSRRANDLRSSVRSAFPASYFTSLRMRAGIITNNYSQNGEHIRLSRSANQLIRRTLDRFIERLADTLPDDLSSERLQSAVAELVGPDLDRMVIHYMKTVGNLDREDVVRSFNLPIPTSEALSVDLCVQLAAAMQSLAKHVLRFAGQNAMLILRMEDLSEPQSKNVPLEGEKGFQGQEPNDDTSLAFEDASGALIGYGIIRVLHVQNAVMEDQNLFDLMCQLDLIAELGIVASSADVEPTSAFRRRVKSRIGPHVGFQVEMDSKGPLPEDASHPWLLFPQTMAQWVRRDPRLYLEDYPATQACVRNLCTRYAWFHQPAQIESVLQQYLAGKLKGEGWWTKFHLSPVAYYGRTIQPQWCCQRSENEALWPTEDTEELGATADETDPNSERSYLSYAAHGFDLEDADGRVFPLLIEFTPDFNPRIPPYCDPSGLFERYTGRQLASIDRWEEGRAIFRLRDLEFARFFRRYRPHGIDMKLFDEHPQTSEAGEYQIEIDLPMSGKHAPTVCRSQWTESGLEELVRLCVAGMSLRDEANYVWPLSAFRAFQPTDVRRRFGLARLRAGLQQDLGSEQQLHEAHAWLPDDLLSIIDDYAPVDLPFLALDPRLCTEPAAVSAPEDYQNDEADPDMVQSDNDGATFTFESDLYTLISELDGKARRFKLREIIDDNDAHSRRLPRKHRQGVVQPADRPYVCTCSIEPLPIFTQ